ncbi:MAG: class 1 isoprenoid biosynthesis enzyme [Bacteroidia bacterium]
MFDDFFDEKHTEESHILEMINNPQTGLARNSHEHLFITCYLKALEQQTSDAIRHTCNKVFEAQTLSTKQVQSDLPVQDLLHITRKKGGISLLFYRAGLSGLMDSREKELLLKIGFLGQLENDIFDVYKDYQAGIHTLATRATSMVDLRARFQDILKEVYALIEKTDFPRKNKKGFSRLIAVIAGRGLVCLDQLARLEGAGSFDISAYTRNQLICDMGKARNIIKWLGYYLSWDKNISTRA